MSNPDVQLNEIQVFNTPVKKILRNLSNNTKGINGGFIILKCSDTIKEFIKEFKKYYILFEEKYFDQGCISHLL